MHFIALQILITCALGLYGVKHLQELVRRGVLLETIGRAAKKALRFALKGIAAVGLSCVALSAFPIVREIGFTILPANLISCIRLLMQAVLETNSVYAAIQIFAGIALFAFEFSLLFSIFGLFIEKERVIPHELEFSHAETAEEIQRSAEVAIPKRFRKIFLNFANLRI